MKNVILTILAAFLALNSVGQLSEVRFSEATFDNGMTYPIVEIVGEKVHSDSINADLLRKIADLEASEFCIGQFGYVQKSTHLQIHIFCNCIDFKESQNRYYLFNLEEGRSVPYSDLFNPKEKGAATSYLQTKIDAFTSQNGIILSEETKADLTQRNLDALHVEMTRDGLNIKMSTEQGWDATKILKVSWVELKPFLKYHFI